MEPVIVDAKPGYYYKFIHDNGDLYVVLDGLDPALIHTPGTLETFLRTHYDLFALAYAGLAVATFLYLIGTYMAIPLYLRWKQGLPLLATEDQ